MVLQLKRKYQMLTGAIELLKSRADGYFSHFQSFPDGPAIFISIFSSFFGNLCRHTPILLTKAPILQRLTFFSHLEERMSFHRQWECGEELLQQIWKLVSINGKGKFSILKRNNNFNVHLGGGLSFICVAVRMQARNQVISKELNSLALIFP